MAENAGYTGAELFADVLVSYGVENVFGNPGTTELPVVMAVGDSPDLSYRLALHEDIAVGMAAGYARNRRYRYHDDPTVMPVGVVNLHITPGVAHGLGNLYAADIAGAPLVVTAGNNSLDYRQEEPALSGELLEMVDQFTKWNAEVLDVDTLPTMLRRAFRTALTPPTGPVFLSFPLDVMNEPTAATPERLGPIPTAGRGDRAQIDRAADLLIESEDPVFVVGDAIARSGIDAVEATVALAEVTGAEVYAEMLASEVNFPSAHEQFVSFLPLDAAVAKSAMDAGTVAFIGCATNTPLTSFDGSLLRDDARTIYLSESAHEIGKHHPVDAAVLGDPGSIVRELTHLVAEGVSDEERARRLDRLPTDERSSSLGGADEPPTKVDVANALQAIVPDAYLVDEAITASWALKLRSAWEFEPGHYQLNKGAGLGYGLAAGVGAAMAEAERDDPRPVLCYVGDGSLLYYPQSLYSAARYDLDMTIVVPDNRSYEVLKMNVTGMYGGERSDYDFEMMDIAPPVALPQHAESQGVPGRLVETVDELEPALEEAIATDGPVLLDVLIREE